MENDFVSWFLDQLPDRQKLSLNAFGVQLNIGPLNTMPVCLSSCANFLSSKENLLASPFSGVPHFHANQLPNEPHGWFYCLPQFCQALTPAPSSGFKEKFPPSPNPMLGCAQKRLLVFDQSGDQTTIVFIPVIGSPPVQCPTRSAPKHGAAYALNKIELLTERDPILHLETVFTYESEENKNDTGSEMYHEDTEEINALLYSDDDVYDEYEVYSDDEVASTGHSPSGMMDYGKQELVEESEKVVSYNGPAKRRKLLDGGYELPSLMDTATSVKSQRCFDCEDDAEFSCADDKSQGLGEFGYYTGNSRLMKDKESETLGILQNLIPGGEGKDAIGILDEAIDYLRLSKRKAKALLVDTL